MLRSLVGSEMCIRDSANTIYNTGDVVLYNGKEYKARWWTKGDNPATSSVWEEVIPDDGTVRAWRADLVYNTGDLVSHDGMQYEAQWWTQGQAPGSSSVWRKL